MLRTLAKSVLETKSVEVKISNCLRGSPLSGDVELTRFEPVWEFSENLKLVHPRELPVQGNSREITLLHGIAHIEFIAVHMYWDTIARFPVNLEFVRDFAGVAKEEATHFTWLKDRLIELGSNYPMLHCHNALVELSDRTNEDLLGRIVVLSLYSEARALDSADRLIAKLKSYNQDQKSACLLEKILEEEIAHVALGVKWFREFSKENSQKIFKEKVEKYIGKLRAPFNVEARNQAGMPTEWFT